MEAVKKFAVMTLLILGVLTTTAFVFLALIKVVFAL